MVSNTLMVPFEWYDGCVVFTHFKSDPIHYY